MDFLSGFILGYFLKIMMSYLKQLAEDTQFNNKYKTIIELDKEWDWISYKEDDLP
jgi:hypothetical protein|tara:strand:- start:201 stop:365 length:165 start_codon:yes stop_codon:yes gene_type:complete